MQAHYFSRAGIQDLDAGQLQWNAVVARATTLQFASAAGIFSKSHLDPGTRLLISHLPALESQQVCDLGCGWGAVGCFAAALTPSCRVAMCDINPRAVMMASLNASRNRLDNAAVWCGDGLAAVHDDAFDMVFSNPPIRAGNAVIERLFADAHRCLKRGGALLCVMRTSQGAKSWQRRLSARFDSCEVVDVSGGYRILKSIK